MTTLLVDHSDCTLDVENGRIVMRREGERAGTWPLIAIERIVASRGTKISGRLLAELSERGIGLMLDPGKSRAAPAAFAPARGDRTLRRAQHSLEADTEEREKLATALVASRLSASIARLGRRLPGHAVLHALVQQERSLSAGPRPIAQLRGIEGAAVARVFELFAMLVPRPFTFGSRSRRPPRDPVNVCLSLGYTLAQMDAERACAVNGLDPQIGFYHEPAPGRASLACDLVEHVRPDVEDWVLTFLASGEIGTGEFSESHEGCTLSKSGRRTLYRNFEDHASETIRDALSRRTADLVNGLRARIGRTDAAGLFP